MRGSPNTRSWSPSNIRNIPSAITLECPRCGESMHRILRGRQTSGKGDRVECTVKCSKCGGVKKTIVKRERPVSVKLIVSEEEKSKKKEIELFPSEEVAVGDRIIVNGVEIEVTSIESNGKRVSSSYVEEIDTLWTRRADKVKVRFSINKGPRTLSKEIYALPEEEFFVGDMVEIGRMKVIIHKIKCKDKMVRTGGTQASEIVRIYARAIKETWV